MPRQRSTSENRNTGARVRQAAIELFAERGFHGTGIRDIATAADVTTSALYHYMSNKDDLLFDVMNETITPLRDAARDILESSLAPSESLAAIVAQHVWVHASDRIATLVTDTELRALSDDHRTTILALRDDYEGLWREAVAAGVRADEFEVEQPQLAARALVQMSTGVSHWFSSTGRLSLEGLCEQYAQYALSLVCARAGGAPGDGRVPGPAGAQPLPRRTGRRHRLTSQGHRGHGARQPDARGRDVRPAGPGAS